MVLIVVWGRRLHIVPTSLYSFARATPQFPFQQSAITNSIVYLSVWEDKANDKGGE